MDVRKVSGKTVSIYKTVSVCTVITPLRESLVHLHDGRQPMVGFSMWGDMQGYARRRSLNMQGYKNGVFFLK